jgi:hypothetical protein
MTWACSSRAWAWEQINRAAASGVKRHREERDIGHSLAKRRKDLITIVTI